MTNPSKLKHVCIHGHFYQPPRENPWLEELETEVSAAPYHDWNERIHVDCYRANAAARLVDDQNLIISLRNNYRSLSFNFGPTLLRWIEKHDPWLYQIIVDSDKESCEQLAGHGNAMAQVYNHLIMPLANRRDKVTQVLWGIRDFESRFGRTPEGMWLAETAVDRESLSILAEAGIKFTILSPFQALRWRFLDKQSGWQDARDANIPTGRAYRYHCGGGKSINIFFYDASLAKGIAFERLLEHSSHLLCQINWSYEQRAPLKDEPWLVHSATDGESYGHHFRFGDMALAAALRDLERDPGVLITNYGAFLASFPVRAVVEIQDNTSWSCAHGVGRWEKDCGCRISGEPGWNQKWRAPLREAMNGLRDALAAHYEKEMGKLHRDPWKVRDEYINVLVHAESREHFAQKHISSAASADVVMQRFFQLLEMQRAAMAMFTSCGWFFDEISDIGSIINLRFAARSIQLAGETGADVLKVEGAFLKVLEQAKSNKPGHDSAATVYLTTAKSEIVQKARVAANYALQTIARSSLDRHNIYCYVITPERQEDLGSNPVPCLYGQINVKDSRTLEEEDFLYAVFHFGGLDFRCSVKSFTDLQEYESILKTLQHSVESQNTVQMIRVLDSVFGTLSFGLQDVFRDQRSAIALDVAQDKLSFYTAFQRHLYQTYRPLIMSLKQLGIQIPSDLQTAVRRVLSDEVNQLVNDILDHEEDSVASGASWQDTDFFFRAHIGRLESLLDDASSWGVSLEVMRISGNLGKAMVEALSTLGRSFGPSAARRLSQLMSVCLKMGIKTEVWNLQTLYFDLLQTILKDCRMISQVPNIEGFLNRMDSFLGCRFVRFLTEHPSR